jgi:predicted MFS family arabinose efflux permease
MAFATGASVANLWYNQPLLTLMSRTFHVSSSTAGSISMLTQIGYAVGLIAFVPLADLVERKKLILILLGIIALVSLTVAASPAFWWLAASSFLLGVVTVVPQIIIPVAADLADSRSRGRVVGIVMSGLLIGILGARTASGLIGGALGWRAVFVFGAMVMALLTILIQFTFPIAPPHGRHDTYFGVIRSIVPIMRQEPELNRASITGGALFGAFNIFWTTLTFRLGTAPYHYNASVIGLFGLLGVAGASVAPLAGRLADRRDPRVTVTYSIVFTIVAFIWLAPLNGSLWALITGIVLLDLGVQSGQISNQSRIYALRPDARARLNTVYMGSYFIGGSLGAGIGSWAWGHWAWTGVTITGLAFLTVAAAVHLHSLRKNPLTRKLA